MKTNSTPKNTILNISILLLVFLWASTGLSKILEYDQFAKQLSIVLGERLSLPLSVAIPSLELIAALALVFHKTKIYGLYLSFLLISAFTVYATLVIAGYFGPAPCTCGGIISGLSWSGHLTINLLILLIVLYSLLTLKRKEAALTL